MSSNAYMRAYMLRRYHTRRAAAIAKLGGKCKCGSAENLELDHIDPESKSFDIAKMWSKAEKIFWVEVAKCQVLCKRCHIDKTIRERGFTHAKNTHGTLSAYRYCTPVKCELCKAAKREYARTHRTDKSRKRASRK